MANTEDFKIHKVQQMSHGDHSAHIITLPKEYCHSLGLEKGDYVKIILKDKSLIINKIELKK